MTSHWNLPPPAAQQSHIPHHHSSMGGGNKNKGMPGGPMVGNRVNIQCL